MSMISKLGSTVATTSAFITATMPGVAQKAAEVAPQVATKAKQGWLMRKLTSLPFIATLGLTGAAAIAACTAPGAELVATKVLPWLAGAGAGCWDKVAWAGKGIGSWFYSFATSPFGGAAYGSMIAGIGTKHMYAKSIEKGVAEAVKAATKV